MDPQVNPTLQGYLGAAEADLDREVEQAVAGLSDADLAGSVPARSAADGESEFAPGTLIRGKVANVASTDVLVDLGGKMLGVAPRGEFDAPLAVGDEIDVVVNGMDERGGLVLLSRRKAVQAALWRDLHKGQVLEGHVSGMNKGGLEVFIHGVRAFIPASQVDTHFLRDISELIGQNIMVEVVKFNRDDQNLVVSRRTVLEREASERRERMLTDLQVGQNVTGTVRNVTDYGAFIELAPGVDGLLHVSDMSWGRVKTPADLVSVGQTLDLQILKVNRETGKISLGLKQVRGNPWENVAEKYQPQQRITGRVARLTEFGAFVELEEGVDALLPVGEMTWTRRIRHPKEVVNEGDIVEAVILAVDSEKKRISLGMKQLVQNPWDNIAERYPVNATVPGKVTRLADFGAFVELETGVEGLLHISEISEQRIRTVADKLQEGQEVQVRILRIDLPNKRISLSMKQPSAEVEAVAEAPRPAPRKRAQPLRGGIDMEWGGGGLGSLDPTKYAR